MELIRHILNEMGADTVYAFTVVPGFGAYLGGVSAVAEFTPSRVVLRAGKNVITLTGEKFSVGSFSGGDMFVSGKVAGVQIDGEWNV